MKLFCSLVLLVLTLSSIAANVYYLDPVNGDLANDGSLEAPWSSLREVINADYITTQRYFPLPYDPLISELQPKNIDGRVCGGDTLVLLNGLHGNLFMQNYINEQVITILGAEGHTAVIEKVKLRACKNWRFENVCISSEPYGYYLNDRLFYIESHSWQGPSSNIVIDKCRIYSTTVPWETALEWQEQVSHGLYIQGDSIVASNNLITNVDMGLTALGDHILAENNQIVNFSGDGMRLLGSYTIFKGNLIKNCYDVDDNHDDGIQSFTTNGLVVDHNQVLSNIIINTDDESRPLNGPMQGIGLFDGFFNDWIVANNVVNVNHWHGITFLGANNCQVINNTVLDPTPDITPGGSWIRIDDHKNGTPSSNCIVANNVANQFVVDGLETNNLILNTYSDYAANFVDYENTDFHLLPSSVLIDAANPTYAPEDDLDGQPRPVGNNPDIGAYELMEDITSTEERPAVDMLLYPNPFRSEIHLMGAPPIWTAEVYNFNGSLMAKVDNTNLHEQLVALTIGNYVLRILDQDGEPILVQVITKQ